MYIHRIIAISLIISLPNHVILTLNEVKEKNLYSSRFFGAEFTLSEANVRLRMTSLAVMPATERGVPQRALKDAYEIEIGQKLAPYFGGKSAFDIILENLSKKIGYSIPGSLRFTIKEIWGEFIEANRTLIDEGNKHIQSGLAAPDDKVTAATIDDLRYRLHCLVFPPKLEFLIRYHADELKGWIIVRSTYRRENSRLKNLAGKFISPKKRDERLVLRAVKEIFFDAAEKIWIGANEGEKRAEGLPNILTVEEGFGVLIQPFLPFTASGTAMTNRYGHTSIKAVIGDAETAVQPIRANACQFLFDKANPSRFEYNPSFLEMPYEVILNEGGKEKRYCATDNPEEMRGLLERYPKIDGEFSPITEEQAKEVYRVTNSLENEIGAPLDIEWGILNGNRPDWKLYIIQARWDIGDFKRPLVEMSAKLKRELRGREPIARTPIAIGHTSPDGFTGKMVVFGDGVDSETVRQFEAGEKPYIRVQNLVALETGRTNTKAEVLVDLNQGSEQAHDINAISDRLARGDFIYCNGPVLKEGLLKNLHFVPDLKYEGVWVSEEEVTYFCDGLRGRFYLKKESAVPVAAGDKLSWDEMFASGEKQIQPQAVAPVVARKPMTEKLQVLFVNDHEHISLVIKDRLAQAFGLSEKAPDCVDGKEYTIFFASNTGKAKKIINENRIDYIITDWMLADEEETAERLLRYAEASGIRRIDMFTAAIQYIWKAKATFPKLEIGTFPYASWESGKNRQIERIKYAREEYIRRYKALMSIPRPEKPPKLKALFIDGDYDTHPGWMGSDGDKFHRIPGADEYEFFFAGHLMHALELMEYTDMDLIVFDIELREPNPSTVQLYGDFFEKTAVNSKAVVLTQLAPDMAKDRLKEKFNESLADRIPILPKPMRVAEKAVLLQKYRESQIEDYQRTLAEWDALHTAQSQAAVQPAPPEKLRVLCVEDDPKQLEGIRSRISGAFHGDDNYEFVYAGDMEEAVLEMEQHKPHVIVFDLVLEDSEDNSSYEARYYAGLKNVTHLYAVSATNEHEAKDTIESVATYFDLDLSRVTIVPKRFVSESRAGAFADQLIPEFKKIRESQEKEWRAAHPEAAVEQKEPSAAKGPTIFVIANLSGEGDALAKFVERSFSTRPASLRPAGLARTVIDSRFRGNDSVEYKYNVIPVTGIKGMYFLKQQLGTVKPDIVIADTVVDNADESGNIMDIVRAKNPEAKFIFTSEEAAITENNPKGEGVLATLETPFHFQDAVDVLNGTYDEKRVAARERFRIEESADIVRKMGTVPTSGQGDHKGRPYTSDSRLRGNDSNIRLWGGYAASDLQKNILTRVRTKTANAPYRIDFDDDLDKLVKFACAEADNDNAVTILPSNRLTEAQKGQLKSAEAHVIFVEEKSEIASAAEFTLSEANVRPRNDGMGPGTDDIVQLGAIIFTGIAYLNNNDAAMMSLYRLLTGQRHEPVTIEELKRNPALLVFIFEPAAIHDYSERKRLNDLMEKSILSAA